MKKKTSADYQRQYRKRLRDQGLVKKEVWILPENSHALNDYEKSLRVSAGDLNLKVQNGGSSMNQAAHKWTTESLFDSLADRPAFSNGSCSIEMIDGLDSSIVISMHEYGDLPVFITVGGDQILVEAILFAMEDVKQVDEFNAYVLKAHKYLPLSTICIETDADNNDYYHMFGALSATSSINQVVLEIETLADNVIQATEAFKSFLNV